MALAKPCAMFAANSAGACTDAYVCELAAVLPQHRRCCSAVRPQARGMLPCGCSWCCAPCMLHLLMQPTLAGSQTLQGCLLLHTARQLNPTQQCVLQSSLLCMLRQQGSKRPPAKGVPCLAAEHSMATPLPCWHRWHGTHWGLLRLAGLLGPGGASRGVGTQRGRVGHRVAAAGGGCGGATAHTGAPSGREQGYLQAMHRHSGNAWAEDMNAFTAVASAAHRQGACSGRQPARHAVCIGGLKLLSRQIPSVSHTPLHGTAARHQSLRISNTHAT